MRGWLQVAFAVFVISGWFLLALWMVLSVVQVGMLTHGGRSCSVASSLEVTCSP